jgi:cytidyltransferase-like protein
VEKMKIGIIGGAFDPVHYGHLEMGKEALKKLELEEVWFMPCYNHVFDKKIESFSYDLETVQANDFDKLNLCKD